MPLAARFFSHSQGTCSADGLTRSILALLLATGMAHAQSTPEAQLCRSAIAAAENSHHVPDAFLSAIARVESGRPVDGTLQPWPWTVDAEGQGAFYASKAEAIAAVHAAMARGIRSIDVGCMQVNLLQHPEAFHSLEEAFDPGANAQFAAGLLVSLFGQFGSWPLAAAAYHSQTPGIGAAYQKQVLAAWAMPDRPTAASAAGRPQQKTPQRTDAPPPLRPDQTREAAATPAFGHTLGVLAAEQPRNSGVHAMGKSLDAYRAVPVRLALRPTSRAG